jgi:signal peptidase I
LSDALPPPVLPFRRGAGRQAVTLARDIIIMALAAAILSSVVTHAVLRTYRVPSGSMQHTLEEGDRIWVWLPATIRRGDVVVFRDDLDWLQEPLAPLNWQDSLFGFFGFPTANPYRYLVKRLIGLPGDRVQRRAGQLVVNGYTVTEPYVYNSPEHPPAESDFDLVVPRGRAFVLGDHRNDSADSLYHLCAEGPSAAFVPLDVIVGSVAIVGPPYSRLGPLDAAPDWADVPRPAVAAPSAAVVTSACQ